MRAVLVEVRPVEDDGVHEALEERRRVDVDEVEEHPVARQVLVRELEEVQGQRGQAGVDAHVRADLAVDAAAAAPGQRQDELARAAPRVEPGHLAAPGLLLVLVVPAADVLDLAHVVVLDDRLPQRARLLRLRLGPLLPALPALALLVLLARAGAPGTGSPCRARRGAWAPCRGRCARGASARAGRAG